MTRQRHPARRRDFPTSLNGGEGHDGLDHRIGETERQSPQIDRPDPAGATPQPEREAPEKPEGAEPTSPEP